MPTRKDHVREQSQYNKGFGPRPVKPQGTTRKSPMKTSPGRRRKPQGTTRPSTTRTHPGRRRNP